MRTLSKGGDFSEINKIYILEYKFMGLYLQSCTRCLRLPTFLGPTTPEFSNEDPRHPVLKPGPRPPPVLKPD